MSNELKAGDEVQLRSGGPVMTIDSINTETGRAACVWFDSKHVMQTAKFAISTLDKYDSSADGGGFFVG
ncbi:MAG TPA: DUF2158 domain-containing protein [Mucilaginibacter sp.]|nr:DUF2158 domain-containing protein [Mucilaginibacter sp.]